MNKIINAKNLIYLVVFSTPLYLIKLKIFSVPTNVLELLILFAFFLWLYKKKSNVKCQMSIVNCQRYFLPVFLILLGLFASTLINNNYRIGFGIIKSWFVIPLILAFLIIKEIKNEKEIQNILKALYFSALAVSISGLMYYFSGDLTYDGRLKAFYLSPNYLAMFLAPALIIRIMNYELRIKNILADYAVFFIILFSFYLTYSYAAWVAVILSLILVSLIKREKLFKKTIVASCLLSVVGFILISQIGNPKFQDLIILDTRSSLASRVMIWKSATKILGNNWIFGIGPGNFQNTYLEYQKYFPPYLEWAVPQPHNLYLAFWLQGGILGIIGFLWLVSRWIEDIIKQFRHPMSKLLLGILFYILIHGLADTTYWKNDLSVIFWTTFALGIAISKEATEAKS